MEEPNASPTDIEGVVSFLRAAEQLKDVLRNSWTSQGRRESAAEHSWRLCLMAMVLHPELTGLDFAKLIKICIIHDLGEAIHGDVPAVETSQSGAKANDERRDLLQLLEALPDDLRQSIASLWDEYAEGVSPEAKIAKALDKLETIMQHNQGQNPNGFDYGFNLQYGRAYTSENGILARIREILDRDTERRAGAMEAS